MRRRLTSSVRVLGIVTITLLNGRLAAQELNVSAQAGRIRSSLDPAATSTETFALGLRYDDASAGLRLNVGVPRRSLEPLWSGLSAWRRISAVHRGFRGGIDLQGSAFLTHDRAGPNERPVPGLLDPPLEPDVDRSGHALAGQVLPVIGYEATRFQIHARAGVSRYSAQFGRAQLQRNLRLADLQVTLSNGGSFALSPVLRYFVAPGERATTYAGVSAIGASNLGVVWAGVGTWSNNASGRIPWNLGARWRVHRAVTLDASARHDAFDPLYLQAAQTSWSVGLSFQVWRRSLPSAAPVPARYADGRATIRLSGEGKRAHVAIAGDFNKWKPQPMQRSGDDWLFTVALSPGVYNYSFVDAEGNWFVPEQVAGRRDDGMGGHVALLVVQ